MWIISIKKFQIFRVIQLFMYVQPAVDAYTVTTRSFEFSFYGWLMQLLLNFYN